MPWIVVIAKGSREAWCQENLLRQGFQSYYPRILTSVRYRSEEYLVAKPLFPKYVFTLIKQQWYVILSTFGVQGVLLRHNVPEVVPDWVIEQLRDRETNGYVELPRRQNPQQGDPVRIQAGIFDGKEGIHAGMPAPKRTRVLLDFLGRQTPVTLDSDTLTQKVA